MTTAGIGPIALQLTHAGFLESAHHHATRRRPKKPQRHDSQDVWTNAPTIRPCVSYAPFVDTKHRTPDIVIVRETKEDLYTGIEHRQTDDVSRNVLETDLASRLRKSALRAFEYAVRHKQKVFHQDNIT